MSMRSLQKSDIGRQLSTLVLSPFMKMSAMRKISCAVGSSPFVNVVAWLEA